MTIWWQSLLESIVFRSYLMALGSYILQSLRIGLVLNLTLLFLTPLYLLLLT
jgi:hypothetical protein